MKKFEKYDRDLTGILCGLLLPIAIMLIVWAFSSGDLSLTQYIGKLNLANIVTHIVSLSVFPNLVFFLIFNRFDMLKASRGVLAATIVWAITVFGIKFLG